MDFKKEENKKYKLIAQKRVVLYKLDYWENQLRSANKYIKKYKDEIKQLKKEIKQ